MKFSEFFDKVCIQLHAQHEFAAPRSHLMAHIKLLDAIYNGYQEALKERDADCLRTRGVFERCDWDTHIRNTAKEVNKQDEPTQP